MASYNDLIDWLLAGDAARVRQVAAEAPKAFHTFGTVRRVWGEEMWLPLHHAAANGCSEMVGLCIDLGAGVESRTRFRTPYRARQTALHLAAEHGHAQTVALLLERGAGCDLRDAEQLTPLALAARGGWPDAARALLARHAEVDPRDSQQRTPLHLLIAGPTGDPLPAAGSVPARLEESLEADRLEVARLLLDAGADANAQLPRDPECFTPLHRCAQAGPTRLSLARLLLERGADTALRDPRSGQTAADHAAALGETELASLLSPG